MSTSQRLKLQPIDKPKFVLCPNVIRMSYKRLKAALIGLLLICATITVGCTPKSAHPVAPEELTVDASLLSPSNYTNQLLKVLSE